MAKDRTTAIGTLETSAASMPGNEMQSGYDPDVGLRNDPSFPERGQVGGSAASLNSAKVDHDHRTDIVGVEMSPENRLLRLERLALLHFGNHNFEVSAPVFNPENERESARARYVADMERIDAEARAKAN